MDVAQRLQELRAFDGNLHCNTRLIPRDGKAGRPKRRAAAFRPGSLIKAGFDQTRGGTARVARIGDKRKGGVMPFPTFREKGNLGDEGVPIPLRGGVGCVGVFASPACLAPPLLTLPRKAGGNRHGLTPVAGASAIQPLRIVRHLLPPGPRSCARHAAPWYGRVPRTGGRSQAASAASGFLPDTSRLGAGGRRWRCGARTTGRSG